MTEEDFKPDNGIFMIPVEDFMEHFENILVLKVRDNAVQD